MQQTPLHTSVENRLSVKVGGHSIAGRKSVNQDAFAAQIPTSSDLLYKGVVAAIGRLGDRRALIPLVRLYTLEEAVSLAGATSIRQAFRDIVRREGVTNTDPSFTKLKDEERSVFDRLYPKSKNGNGNGKH